VIEMARALNLRVVAEGIETPAQLEFLTGLRCDEGQGYHFSRPLPAARFTQLLHESRDQRLLPMAA
jgi:EAL domain-containing protein (putative c-di-GMP-specific phosphodiesterase class I)